MIDFGLSEEQVLLQQEAARTISEMMPTKRVREIEAAGNDFDEELLRTIARLGWFGVAASEQYGGEGGLVEAAVIAQELGAALAPVPYVETVCGVRLIERYASEDLKAKLLPRLITSEQFVLPVLSLSGGDLHVVEQSDGSAIVRGRLPPTRYVGRADLIIAGAWHASGKHELLLIDPHADGSARIQSRAVGGERLVELTFEGALVPFEHRMRVVAAPQATAAFFEPAWALSAAGWCGAARRVLDVTVAYTKDRRQFDRAIGSFQAVQHELAWVDVDTYGARLLSFQAAAAVGRDGEMARLFAPEAALVSAAAYRRAVRAALQFHGGYGYTMEYDAQLFFRRARSALYSLGTTAEIRRHACAVRAAPEGDDTKDDHGL